MQEITNWGNFPKIQAELHTFDRQPSLKDIILNTHGPVIARGNGRCYGDSALSPEIISTLNYNRILKFDARRGVITCESGILLRDIIDHILPHGYFLPVTPGTKFVTLGGAVASDVHGKNHHSEGSFSRYVDAFTLMNASGKTITCTRRGVNADIFEATCGGMGLTGIIMEITFRLKKIETAYIKEEILRARDIHELMALTEESGDYTYNVSWIDGLASGKKLGRGVLFRGEHCLRRELPVRLSSNPLVRLHNRERSVPFYFPRLTLNRLSVGLFNSYFFLKQSPRPKSRITYFDGFFYPMDGLLNWNRIYGRRGFLEYQFVMPLSTSLKGITEVFSKIRKEGAVPFFSGLKLFGKQKSVISFPIEGYTVAFDFPATQKNLNLLDRLDLIVLENGGRIYLTKDARMNRTIFEGCYSTSSRFKRVVRKINPDLKFSSLQSERVGVTS